MPKTHSVLRFVAMLLLLCAAPAYADSVTLAWDPSPDANVTGYIVGVGTSPGVYTNESGVGNVTTWTVGGLTAGRTYYFAVKAIDNSGTQSAYSNEVTSVITAAAAPADLVSPAPGSTLTGAATQMAWTAGTGVTGYRLAIGTATGGSDLANVNAGTSLSTTVSGLPTDGRALYVRLSSLIGTTWQYHDYRYTAATVVAPTPPPAVPAQLTSPAPGSTLAGATAQFQWTAATGATAYTLRLGSTAGGSDLFTSSSTSSLSVSVSGLPTDGRAIYAQLQWTGTTSGTTSASYHAAAAVVPTTRSYSIWSTSTVPGAMEYDAHPVELGLKFTSDVSGYITGIRFYKYSKNTGTHVGTLWTRGGTRLGTVTFSGETASGWQTATFATPIAISANTTYIVSYHTNAGYYAVTAPGLTNAVNAPPLHALSNSTTGGNGVYAYRSTPGFPTQTYASSNYWVDVIFSPK